MPRVAIIRTVFFNRSDILRYQIAKTSRKNRAPMPSFARAPHAPVVGCAQCPTPRGRPRHGSFSGQLTAQMGAAFLPVHGAGKVASVRVHPVVVFNACDSYVRRQETQERVIGTLLGTVRHDGVVEVKNSYAVPHNEQNGQVYVDVEFHRAMIDLHLRVNPAEKIVGWYSTGDGVVPTDALIHEFYAHECHNPVHVTLDVTFADRDRLVRAWVGQSLALGSKDASKEAEKPDAEGGEASAAEGILNATTAIHFQEVALVNTFDAAERVGVASLAATNADVVTDGDDLGATAAKLRGMLEKASAYVDAVVAGKTKGDAEIGRRLADALSSVPGLTKSQFEKLFGESAQDALLVTYLSNVTKMQLMLAEKLQTASLLI